MSDLSAEYVRSILSYDKKTGVFTRRRNGKPAGGIDTKGYHRIYIDGKHYASHRLAWLFVFGVWPKKQIDHINRDTLDNRIANLRDVSGSENCKNRKSGPRGRRGFATGVTKHKKGKWQAQFWCPKQKKIIYAGLFDDREKAVLAAKRGMDI